MPSANLRRALGAILSACLVLSAPGPSCWAAAAAASAAGRAAPVAGIGGAAGAGITPIEGASLSGAAFGSSRLPSSALWNPAAPQITEAAGTAFHSLPRALGPVHSEPSAAVGPLSRSIQIGMPAPKTPAAGNPGVLGAGLAAFEPRAAGGERAASSPAARARRAAIGSRAFFDGDGRRGGDALAFPARGAERARGTWIGRLGRDLRDIQDFVRGRTPPSPIRKAAAPARTRGGKTRWVRAAVYGSVALIGVLILVKLGFGEAVPGLLGAALMAGTLGRTGGASGGPPLDIVTRNGALQGGPAEFWVNVGTPTDMPTEQYKQGFLRAYGIESRSRNFEWINGYRLKIVARDADEAEALIREIAARRLVGTPVVTSISAHPDMMTRLEGRADGNIAARDPGQSTEKPEDAEPASVQIVFSEFPGEAVFMNLVRTVQGKFDRLPSWRRLEADDRTTGLAFTVRADELAELPWLAARLKSIAANPSVSAMFVHESLIGALREATEPAADLSKFSFGAAPLVQSTQEFWVSFQGGVSAESAKENLAALGADAFKDRSLGSGIQVQVLAESPGDAARLAAAISRLDSVSEVSAHPGLGARLLGPEADPGEAGPKLYKTSVHESVSDRNDIVISFAEDAGDDARRVFLKEAVLKNAVRYSWADGRLVLHARDNGSSARILAAAEKSASVAAAWVNAHTREDMDRLLKSAPGVFARVLPNNAEALPDAPDEDRAIVVQFRPDASAEEIAAYAERWGLSLIEADYRGAAGWVVYEVPESAAASWTVAALSQRPVEDPVLSVRPLKGGRIAAENSAEPADDAAPLPRRDARSEFLEWLSRRKLIDGESSLTPEQVKGLARFLKPVQPPATEAKHPTIGRTPEIKKILPILTSPRGMRNSVILIGEPGVGKTAIAEGLARLIEDAEHAEALRVRDGESAAALDLRRLRGRWLVELDVDRLLTSDDPVGTLMSILELLPLLNEPSPGRGNEVLLLVDEIQKLMMDPAGKKIANAIKGHLRDGRISVIATTTSKEYKQYIESDGALARRFQTVRVAEPSVSETVEMLRGAKAYYESQHDAEIPSEALEAAAKLSHQFDKERYLPDKAVKLVEDAAELARPDNLRGALALEIREGWRRMASAVEEARRLLVEKNLPSAVALPAEAYNRVAGLASRIARLYEERERIEDGKGKLTIEILKKTLADATGISAGQLTLGEEDASRFVNMEAELAERVVNQERALEAIANAVRRNKAGLSNPNRPMGKFLFAGPTGVGKTYIVKELARFLFNDPEAMIRFDMSEFMEEHTYMRLVGAPPSYAGFGQGGQLTEAVRKRPYSVLLFDEIEKAHPKVWDVFLQILDDGRLTDSEGRVVDFKNTVIVFTSNTGMAAVDAESFAKRLKDLRRGLGGADDARIREETAKVEAAWDAEIDLAVKEGVKRAFRPEFINRLDEDPASKNKWVRFNRLSEDNVRVIARIQLGEFRSLLKERHGTELEFGEEVIEHLVAEGFSPEYGARPMQGAIEKSIVDPLAKWILDETERGASDRALSRGSAASGRLSVAAEVRGGLIRIGVENGRTVFSAVPKPEKVVEREVPEGLAARLTRELMRLAEGLAAPTPGADPVRAGEEVFDEIYRSLRAEKPVELKGRASLNPHEARHSGASAPLGRASHEAPPPAPRRLTPHQRKALARDKALLMGVLASKKDDGPVIKVAAASSWAMLAGTEDLPEIRGWFLSRGWAAGKSESGDWPMIMAAAQVMERRGEPKDLGTFERLAAAFNTGGDLYAPARKALEHALGRMYLRFLRDDPAMLDRVRLGAKSPNSKVKAAALAAMAAAADPAALTPEDAELIGKDPRNRIRLLERADPAAAASWVAERWPPAAKPGEPDAWFAEWTKLSEGERIALLEHKGRISTGDGEDFRFIARQATRGNDYNERKIVYAAAAAYADIAERLGLSGGLGEQLDRVIAEHTFTVQDTGWGVLLALLYTAERTGGAEALPALAKILQKPPHTINYYYETPYFESPLAWAKVAVRSGMISAFMRPGRGGDGGSPALSKIQEMLTSHKPMETAAALYAVALARGGLGGSSLDDEGGPAGGGSGGGLPDLTGPDAGLLPEPPPAPSYVDPYSYPHGRMFDHEDHMHWRFGRRFGRHLPPAM